MTESINTQGTVFLLSSAVDRLFLELLKYEKVTEMNPEVLKAVQNATEAASMYIACIKLIGGEE